MTDITVAMCTWNRAGILDGTLAAVAALRAPEGVTWELVVVDNNSTDDTPAVLGRYADKLPLRVVRETRQGTSHARNAAVAAVRSDWFVFLDDDCRPEPDLLEQYAEAARLHPDVALFGGTMRPDFESPPPAWFADNLDLLGPVTAGNEKPGPNRPLGPTEAAFTGNVMLRTAVARAYPFDTRLGYVGGNRMAGEDIDLYVRVVGGGHRAYWWGTAVVRHFLPARAVTAAAVARKYHGDGRAEVRMHADEFRRLPAVLGVPRWAVRQYLTARVTHALLSRWNARRWLVSFQTRHRMAGLIAEMWAARRGRPAARDGH